MNPYLDFTCIRQVMDWKYEAWQQKRSNNGKWIFVGFLSLSLSLSSQMRFHISGLNTTFGFIFTKWLGHLLSAARTISHLLIDTSKLQGRKFHIRIFPRGNYVSKLCLEKLVFRMYISYANSFFFIFRTVKCQKPLYLHNKF